MIDIHTANSPSFLSRIDTLFIGGEESPIFRLLDRVVSAVESGDVDTFKEAEALIDIDPVLLAAALEVWNACLLVGGRGSDLATDAFADLLEERFPFRAVLVPDEDGSSLRIEGFVPATREGKLLS